MNNNMQGKILFMGVTQFALSCFDKLMQMGLNVVGCVYTKDQIIMKKQPNGMQNVTFVDFNAIAEENQIEAIFFDKSDTEPFEQKIQEIKPDLIIVAGWHYIIKPEMLKLPRLGVVGLHSSILPRYRGGSPLVWQIINGESKAGMSLFYLEEGIDTGNVIGQIEFEIEETDRIKEALVKSQQAAISLIDEFVPQILQGTAPSIKQNDKDAFYVKQRFPHDGEIDWNDTPQNIKNFIKAQAKPYPGAFTYMADKKVVIWDADIIEN